MGFGWSLAWRSGRGGHLALTLPIWAAAEPRVLIAMKEVTFLPVQAAEEHWDAAGSRRDLCGAPEARGCSRGTDSVVSGTKGPLLAGTPHVG